jgi:hypothetical protein
MVAQSPVWALRDRGVEMTHASRDNGERNTVFDLGLAREILSGTRAVLTSGWSQEYCLSRPGRLSSKKN